MKVEKEVWVIMDKGRKAIGGGNSRDRHLMLIDEPWNHTIKTYKSEKSARSGFKVSQFYLGNASEYMDEAYGVEKWREPWLDYRTKEEHPGYFYRYVDQHTRCEEIYEAVKIKLTLEEIK